MHSPNGRIETGEAQRVLGRMLTTPTLNVAFSRIEMKKKRLQAEEGGAHAGVIFVMMGFIDIPPPHFPCRVYAFSPWGE